MVAKWLQFAAARRTGLLARLEGAADTAIPALEPSPHASLDARASDLRAGAASIDATQFQASLADAVGRKNELQARLTLAKHRAELKTEIARLAERASLDAAKRLTDTTGISQIASSSNASS
jgi:hypothetical protein